jgi:hypothetical protein
LGTFPAKKGKVVLWEFDGRVFDEFCECDFFFGIAGLMEFDGSKVVD